MIKPTIGRVVWFWGYEKQTQPYAALIAFVHSDTMVNLTVFDNDGRQSGQKSVFLYQGDTDRPANYYCEWMPYQQGQAKKTEELEKKLTEQK